MQPKQWVLDPGTIIMSINLYHFYKLFFPGYLKIYKTLRSLDFRLMTHDRGIRKSYINKRIIELIKELKIELGLELQRES